MSEFVYACVSGSVGAEIHHSSITGGGDGMLSICDETCMIISHVPMFFELVYGYRHMHLNKRKQVSVLLSQILPVAEMVWEAQSVN